MSVMRTFFPLVLAGCLFKPSAPGGGDGEPGDGGLGDSDGDVPAATCPDGIGYAFPGDLALRGPPRVGRIGTVDDHEDLVVYGATDDGASAAYVRFGRGGMRLDCYDVRIPIEIDLSAQIIDAWIGKGDAGDDPDLVLFARNSGNSIPGDHYFVSFVPGTSTGSGLGVAREKRISRAVFTSSFGDDNAAFVTVVDNEIVFGGATEPFGAVPIDDELGEPRLVRNTGGGQLFGASTSTSYMWAASTHPERALLVTEEEARWMQHLSTDASSSKYNPDPGGGAGRLLANGPLVRVVMPWSGVDANGHPWAVVQARDYTDESYSFVGLNNGSSIDYRTLPTGTDFEVGYGRQVATVLGRVHPTTTSYFDLISLAKSGPVGDARLNVRVNLGGAGSPFMPVGMPERTVLLQPGARYLAVGDFDGDSTTTDDIIVIDERVEGTLGACYRHNPLDDAFVYDDTFVSCAP